MAIKKFIFETNQNKEIKAEEVFKYMIRHFKLIKIGVEMLKPADIHIAQIISQLISIEKNAKPYLEKFNLVQDFNAIK